MIGKKTLIVLAALLLAGCSSSQSSKSYYQLPSTAGVISQKSAISPEKQVQLISVNVADYLNGLGVVYQTSDVQYVMATNNLWAGSLQHQLQQTLIENLNTALPDWLITSQPITNGNKVLTVNVNGFHGRYDGQAIVRGEWTLTDGNRILTQPFDIQLPQAEDGYDSLIRTLAQAWKQQNDDMAQTIRSTQPVIVNYSY